MEAPDIQQEMLQYFIQLSNKEKKSILQMIKTFLNGKKQHSQPTINIKNYNKEIDEAMARMDAGKFLTQETLENEATQW